MQAGHIFEENEGIEQGRSFLNATGRTTLNAEAEAMADARRQFPYPPKDCADALTTIKNVEDAIEQTQEAISGGNTRVAPRYLKAYQAILGEFKIFVNNAQCVEKAISTENDAFNDQLKQALNQESADASKKNKQGTYVVAGAIALILVGALVIILKKQKGA
jgi:hypothetical protein